MLVADFLTSFDHHSFCLEGDGSFGYFSLLIGDHAFKALTFFNDRIKLGRFIIMLD